MQTNKEIRNNYRALITPTDSVSVEMLEETLELIQVVTRKDERNEVIGEIENWIPDNKFDNFDGGEAIGLKELIAKLNSLK